MAKKQKKRQPAGKKKSVSFLTSAVVIILASFFIGVYISQQEHLRPAVSPKSKKAGQGLPERIIGESDDHVSNQQKSLRPEELSFYKTLLANPERDRTGETPAKRLPKKTLRNSETYVSKTRVRKGGKKEVVSVGQAGEAPQTAPDSRKNRGKYRIQLASFSLRTEAEQMKRNLSSRGYAHLIVKPIALSGKGTWYRVYVGEYGSYAEALKAEERVRLREKLATLVVLERD